MLRLESRLAKAESQIQAKTGRIIYVVEDENFYGNAHLLRRKAAVGDGQAVDEGATSRPSGEGGSKSA